VDKKKLQAQADATFGMKNKKGKKAQQVAKSTQVGRSKEEQYKYEAGLKRKAEKEEQKRIDAENALLFRKVEDKPKPQVVPPGVDPKSVLCIQFKAGKCEFGDKCKFAHDLSLDGKKAKADMFTDSRSVTMDEEALKNQDMSQWDEETTRKILAKKNTVPVNASDKVCHQFLKAIEQKRWGWFWECPNGGVKCPYKHALPPDYVFKKEKVASEVRPLEDIIEEERQKLTGGTKVTPETFEVWYAKIKKQKEEEEKKSAASRQKALKAGQVRMTGREFLTHEGYKETEEEADGEDVDLIALMKAKKQEEEALDEENVRIATELNQAVEEELAETAREKAVEGSQTIETSAEPITTDPTPAIETETVLQNVDTSLFTENIDDIPDDFSDDS